MTRVDRRQPGAEQHERTRLAVVIGQDHRVGALVRGKCCHHALHRCDKLGPADLVRRVGDRGRKRRRGVCGEGQDRQGQVGD